MQSQKNIGILDILFKLHKQTKDLQFLTGNWINLLPVDRFINGQSVKPITDCRTLKWAIIKVCFLRTARPKNLSTVGK